MMNHIAITCLLATLASVHGDGINLGLGGLGLGPSAVYAPGHASLDYYAYPKYAFEYSVKDPHTGDNKAQWEKRDGDVVKGAYSLVEPDGSLRIVEYTADDKSGFNAVVKRVGPNLHPSGPVSPIYKAAIPVIGGIGPISPISVGSVAKLPGLVGAPLISGPVLGGAISTANLLKTIPIVKSIVPVSPILSGPLIKSPLYGSPIVKGPIVDDYLVKGPLLSAPIGPVVKPWPIIKSGPILPGPIIKSAPILVGPGLKGLDGWSEGIGLEKGPILNEWGNIGKGIGIPEWGGIVGKVPIGAPWGLEKGPIGASWGLEKVPIGVPWGLEKGPMGAPWGGLKY